MINSRVAFALLLCSSLSFSFADARERGLLERARAAAPKVKARAKALASKTMHKIREAAAKDPKDPAEQTLGAKARAAVVSLADVARSRGATQSSAKTQEWWESEGRGVAKGKVSQMLDADTDGSGASAPAETAPAGGYEEPTARSPVSAAPPAAGPGEGSGAGVSGFSSFSKEAIGAMPEAPGQAAAAAPTPAAPDSSRSASTAPPTSSFSSLVGDSIRPAQPGAAAAAQEAAGAPQPGSGAEKLPPGSKQMSGGIEAPKPSAPVSATSPQPEPTFTAQSGFQTQHVLTGQMALPGGAGSSGEVHLLSASRGKKPKGKPSPAPSPAKGTRPRR